MFVRTIATIVLATGLAAPAYAQQGEVNKRLEAQKDRIQAGVADDQLTKREAARAERHDKTIHAQEKKDRQENGGTLTPAEKAKLNRELNRNSREIRRARHN
jgi:hypothetical protein